MKCEFDSTKTIETIQTIGTLVFFFLSVVLTCINEMFGILLGIPLMIIGIVLMGVLPEFLCRQINLDDEKLDVSYKFFSQAIQLNDIAKALYVDVSALEDHNIASDNDVMHIFFELEDNYGLKIGRRDDGKAILYFDEKHALGRFHDALLDRWYRVHSSLAVNMEDSDYQEKRKEYDLWKCRCSCG